MKYLIIAGVLLLGATSANASCTHEVELTPELSIDDRGAELGFSISFLLGGDKKARCETEMAKTREQEIINERKRLELCLIAKEAGAPRLIAECKAEGFIE